MPSRLTRRDTRVVRGAFEIWITTQLTSPLPMTVVADHGPEFLDLWLNVVSSHVKDQHIKTILDKIGGVMTERRGR